MHSTQSHHRRRATLLAALATLAVLVLAACGGPGASTESAEGLNDADVTFLQNMVPHHSQAVEMAEMVPDRTDRPELNELADTIITTQTAEVETMNALLTDAGEEPAPSEMGGHSGMSGMMTDDQMAELESLEGEAFDLLFLDMMTQHHQGAVESAQKVLDEGQSPNVAELAEQIIEAQQSEIEQMAQWREQWTA